MTTLTSQQRTFRNNIRTFAKDNLTTARETYTNATFNKSKHPSFYSLLPIYRAAVKDGLLRAQVPAPLGGTSNSLLDMSLMVEELYSVDTSASLTMLGTGLGLTPLILAAAGAGAAGEKEGARVMELVQPQLKPFLEATGEEGDHGGGYAGVPLASLVFSEPQGSANFADAKGDGLQTVAVEDGDDYLLSGEKIWATNCSGWDDRGADLQCVVCRIPGPSPNSSGTTNGTNGTAVTTDNRTHTAILLVTRTNIASNPLSAYTVLSHPSALGHRAVNGPHIRFTSLRVPKSQLLAPPNGTGAALLEATFTGSSALVSAMAVGILRQSFAIALAWAKRETRGSGQRMIEKQSVADLLVSIKMKMEVTRAIARRAVVAFENGENVGRELCYQAKLYGAEAAVEGVKEAVMCVGVASYERKRNGLAELWEDAICLPIFDGGNVGVRRRQVEALMMGEGYDGLED